MSPLTECQKMLSTSDQTIDLRIIQIPSSYCFFITGSNRDRSNRVQQGQVQQGPTGSNRDRSNRDQQGPTGTGPTGSNSVQQRPTGSNRVQQGQVQQGQVQQGPTGAGPTGSNRDRSNRGRSNRVQQGQVQQGQVQQGPTGTGPILSRRKMAAARETNGGSDQPAATCYGRERELGGCTMKPRCGYRSPASTADAETLVREGGSFNF